MITPQYSGVIFSHNPDDVSDDTLHLNIIPGLGELLVSGKEEGFLLRCHKHVWNTEEEKELRGQLLDQEIKMSSARAHEEIKKHLPELLKGTQKLSKLKKGPVDIEFCISDGKVYWLQVRPITTGQEEILVWDKTAAEQNYPGIMLPLSMSLLTVTFTSTYTTLARELDLPLRALKHNERWLGIITGEIKGTLYYNVTAWQKLLYQLPFGKKLSRSICKLWGMPDAHFRKPDTSLFLKAKMLLKLFLALCSFKSVRKKYLSLTSEVLGNSPKKFDLTQKSHPWSFSNNGTGEDPLKNLL